MLSGKERAPEYYLTTYKQRMNVSNRIHCIRLLGYQVHLAKFLVTMKVSFVDHSLYH